MTCFQLTTLFDQELRILCNCKHMKSPTSFEVVRASAGSGKTYRLVSRYLACCLAHDDQRSFAHFGLDVHEQSGLGNEGAHLVGPRQIGFGQGV